MAGSSSSTGSGSGKGMKRATYKQAPPSATSKGDNPTHITDMKARRAKQKLNQKVS